MKRFIFFLMMPLVAFSQNKPKLIVGVVIDQMRYEMLDRFAHDFGENGFNKLVKEGMRFDSCTFQYIPTYTGPGHATIYTGKNPAYHGIISNDMYIPSMGNMIYCVEDEGVEPIGTTDDSERRSPILLQSPTLGDSLKRVDGQSKVIAMSLKDRGAILPGGKRADAAYWMDARGMMVSSSYYMQALPAWVDSFNTNGFLAQTKIEEWDYLKRKKAYKASLPDDAPFESKMFGDKNKLPYQLGAAIDSFGLGSVVKSTPFGSSLLTQFALWALEAEGLGSDNHTDLLAISYSSTDYIGHAFGPQSVEIQDAYLRLDQDLALLIQTLDETVGRENYVLFLTADHGAANTPTDPKFNYVNPKELRTTIDAITQEKYGADLISHIGSQQIWFNNRALQKLGIEPNTFAAEVKGLLQSQSSYPIAEVFLAEEVMACSTGTCKLFNNAYIEGLSGDLFYTLKYGQIERTEPYGTTHGTGHLYDTHVPLLFFGGNVNAGTSTQKVYVNQIQQMLRAYLR